ncbi:MULTISPECIES: hypothetical protein [unclassified Moorena]|uniref:DUF7689 domain-containing protein n=1 Tax=unclassified Moorena TaxID=2683338 RepID=UPI0013BA84B4|nr:MULTISPECIES: hypothetical protein [unclassified Moorena]NEP35633.1 hypothetical protein [Moorena sp. SIO3B2]NEQ07989.1 hypothetical protein [Moorena sp. SIO4E2]NEQ12626.1 hypothetical protein [Moorena sp. SIO3E2]NER86357.1 hypothetical protein [Moorena sp. SIO3A2]
MVGNEAWLSQVRQWIERDYPNLASTNYHITSAVAWAAEDTQRWWWPDPMKESYWPVNVPRVETLLAFIKAFETLGYVICETPDLEENYQKIAIYMLNGQPTHVARQLLNGKWTSKLGQDEDIEHDTLEGLTGERYGQVAQVMKRKVGSRVGIGR